jgi:choline dehydrogenase-like flavoprotein
MGLFFKKLIFSTLISFIAAQNLFAAEIRKPQTNTEQYDYIIVGFGTSGAILARKLSDSIIHNGKKINKSVLVLELGENRNNDPEVLNADLPEATRNLLTYNPKYSVVHPTLYFKNTLQINYSEGVGWGGSSMHNYHGAIRGTPRSYNYWASFSKDSRWAYNNILPAIKSIETFTPQGVAANFNERGKGGPLSVVQLYAPITSTSEPFIYAMATNPSFQNTNVGILNDYNDPTQGDVGFSSRQAFQTLPPNSRRSFAALDLFPIGKIIDKNGNGLNGRKLKITSNALVSKVLLKDEKKVKAIGVEYISGVDPAETIKVYAKQIILCAGASNSPAILQRSGIGNPALLEPLGITVRVNNPNVGAHLHAMYGVTTAISGGVMNARNNFGWTDLRGTLNPRTGLSYYPPDGVRRYEMTNAKMPSGGVQFNTFLMNPKSEGYVKIISKNPLIQPEIDMGFFSDGAETVVGSDAYATVALLRTMKNYASAAGGTVRTPSESTYTSDASLFTFAKEHVRVQLAHNTGTTRMAPSIKEGVVDGQLKVFGVDNLMIADIGVEPIPTDGNTCYGAYVIGWVAAQILGAQ